MKIGIGLPNPIPGADGRTIVEWARRAEKHGFSSLATIDRIAWPSYESLVVLAAAAGATEKIGLLTNVLLGPLRNPVLLAKEAASLDRLSGGRFILGASVGSREDDFTLVGVEYHDRGKRWDKALELMHKIWRGERRTKDGGEGTDNPIGPTPTNGHDVPMLIGGTSDKAIERLLSYGIGWTMGGGGPDRAAPMAEKVRQVWKAADKEGQPRLLALNYFGLGPNAEAGIAAYLGDYYSFVGPWAQGMAANTPRTHEALRDIAKRFEEIGFDELIFDPTIASLDQVDLLAEAVL
jgi:alkanesulfonate monooxygenase SsuD/methylene tetrahydromethanopterin reductase-like flavin-dependent oxidoreductase (luciferase family)